MVIGMHDWSAEEEGYLMPSLPQSLIVRLVIRRVVSPQCWKIETECGTNLP